MAKELSKDPDLYPTNSYHMIFRLKFKNGTLSGENVNIIDAHSEAEAEMLLSSKQAHEVVDGVVIVRCGII